MEEDDSFTEWLEEVLSSDSDARSTGSTTTASCSSSCSSDSSSPSTSSCSSDSSSPSGSSSSPSSQSPHSLSSIISDLSQFSSSSSDGIIQNLCADPLSAVSGAASSDKDLLSEALQSADLGGFKLEDATANLPGQSGVESSDILTQALAQSGVNLQYETVPNVGNVIRIEPHNLVKHERASGLDSSWNPYSQCYSKVKYSTCVSPPHPTFSRRKYRKRSPPDSGYQSSYCNISPPDGGYRRTSPGESGSLTDLTSASSARLLLPKLETDAPPFSPQDRRVTSPPLVPEDTQTAPGQRASALERVHRSSSGRASPYMIRYRECLNGNFRRCNLGVRKLVKKDFSPYELISPGSLSYTPARHQEAQPEASTIKLRMERRPGQVQPIFILDSNGELKTRKSV